MKTDVTKQLEKELYQRTDGRKEFGCEEVTIGWLGKERVDFITYDTKGIIRCYEIKASKSDFYSKAAKTFIGNYNYYVMPLKLYNMVKQDIPNGIGCYVKEDDWGLKNIKKAKKQELLVDKEVIMASMIRSLYRDSSKLFENNGRDDLNRTVNDLRRNNKYLREELNYYIAIEREQSQKIIELEERMNG